MKLTLNKIILVAGILFFGVIAYFVIAIGVRPSGPYEPIASTDFFFDQSGVTKELVFNPHFSKNHEIAILSTPPFPSSEKFNWRIHAEIFRFGMKIQEKVLKESRRTFDGKTLDKQSDISFGWIRTLDMIPGKVVVRIRVVEGDTRSEKYRDSFKVVVRPSPIM